MGRLTKDEKLELARHNRAIVRGREICGPWWGEPNTAVIVVSERLGRSFYRRMVGTDTTVCLFSPTDLEGVFGCLDELSVREDLHTLLFLDGIFAGDHSWWAEYGKRFASYCDGTLRIVVCDSFLTSGVRWVPKVVEHLTVEDLYKFVLYWGVLPYKVSIYDFYTAFDRITDDVVSDVGSLLERSEGIAGASLKDICHVNEMEGM